jgi:site-specific recombinase XerD
LPLRGDAVPAMGALVKAVGRLTPAEAAELTKIVQAFAKIIVLRHACGFALANKGHDTRALQAYLGHRNIQHTVRYTELSPDRFKDFWR